MPAMSAITAPACSELFLQFVLAVPFRVIFECAVHRIAELLKEVHIPAAGIEYSNTSAVFLRFPLDIRKETGTYALIAVWLIHPQHFNKRDVPEVHARKASGCWFVVVALDLSLDIFKILDSGYL